VSDRSVLIAGAGPIGLACAISAKRRNLKPFVIDAGPVVNSVFRYPIGMTFFTTADRLEIGGHPLVCSGQKPTREEALKYYRGVVRAEELVVQPFVKLIAAEPVKGGVRCTVETRDGRDTITTGRLVLATGYYDHPNRLGVPGEDLPQVSHYFDDPHRGTGQDVVVIGGKNSAAEAALELHRAGARVTLVYRGAEFKNSLKYWVKPDLENRIKAGEIAARLSSEVARIEPHAVVIRRGGAEESLRADRVYALTGFHPDFDLFLRIGIALDGQTMRASVDPATLETNVPGVHLAGSISAGRAISEIFIENGRLDGEKIFA